MRDELGVLIGLIHSNQTVYRYSRFQWDQQVFLLPVPSSIGREPIGSGAWK